MKRLVVVIALTGCSSLLGLSEPTQEGDAGVTPDTGDAGPLPGTVRVIMGGTGQQGVVTSEPPGINCPGTCEFTFPVDAEITLSATTTTDTFTGFFQGGCTGGQTCMITPDGQVDVYARYWTGQNLWFTSSTVQHPGAFDSVAAADALCDQLAANAGLIERDYIAYLPTTTKTAIMRMKDLVTVGIAASLWFRPDGELFVGSTANLQQGEIHFPPRLDEFGRDVGDDAIVVTDTNANGTSNAGNHCSDWASESGTAVLAGEAAGGTGRFTSVTTTNCDQDSHIYCVSAIANGLFANPPPSASMVFVTFPTIAANAGVAAMDALCAAEGGLPNPTTRALVSPGGGKPVKDHFTGFVFSSGAVTRPDGVVIAPSMDSLMNGGPFLAAPNVASDLEYRNDVVWVGGGAFNEFTTDCNGWTSTAGFGTTRFAATTAGAASAQQTACSGQAHVLCFNGVVAMAKPTPGNRQPQAPRSRR